jgi:hypothetical protein
VVRLESTDISPQDSGSGGCFERSESGNPPGFISGGPGDWFPFAADCLNADCLNMGWFLENNHAGAPEYPEHCRLDSAAGRTVSTMMMRLGGDYVMVTFDHFVGWQSCIV